MCVPKFLSLWVKYDCDSQDLFASAAGGSFSDSLMMSEKGTDLCV